jgi:hypothetical protein
MPKKKMDKKSDIGVLDKQKNKLEPPKKFDGFCCCDFGKDIS